MDNKVRIAVYVLIFIGIQCCKQTSEPIPLSDSYYPLQKGNEWHYEKVESISFTVSITSKRVIGNESYYIRKSSEFESNEILEREENGVVYRNIEENEYVYLDFNQAINDIWIGPPPGESKFYITSRAVTILTNVGFIYHCIKIVVEDELLKSEHIYAPGVGLISTNIESKKDNIIGGKYKLQWALIDGTVVKLLN